MFESTRIKWASKFGKLEHFFGRWMGVFSLLAIFSIYCDLPKQYTFSLAIATFVCWAIYLVSHTIEKKLYPKRFRF